MYDCVTIYKCPMRGLGAITIPDTIRSAFRGKLFGIGFNGTKPIDFIILVYKDNMDSNKGFIELKWMGNDGICHEIDESLLDFIVKSYDPRLNKVIVKGHVMFETCGCWGCKTPTESWVRKTGITDYLAKWGHPLAMRIINKDKFKDMESAKEVYSLLDKLLDFKKEMDSSSNMGHQSNIRWYTKQINNYKDEIARLDEERNKDCEKLNAYYETLVSFGVMPRSLWHKASGI